MDSISTRHPMIVFNIKTFYDKYPERKKEFISLHYGLLLMGYDTYNGEEVYVCNYIGRCGNVYCPDRFKCFTSEWCLDENNVEEQDS